MKKLVCLFLIFSFIISLASCNVIFGGGSINGVSLDEYSIVYSDEDPDYSKRAAEYIQAQISKRTRFDIPVIEDNSPATEHEIVVGNTNRSISEKLNAETEGFEFAILADGGHVALEADYFIIAAAAYFFIETYVPGGSNEAIPEEISIHTPIVKEAKNFILLIGDGMGPVQTQAFDYLENNHDFSDGEDIFYGYYFPYQGESRTASLSGVTDSAAGGTALSCGYKTINNYVGRNKSKDFKSLTELADELDMSAGVMSTEPKTGATPASFSAHADTRYDNSEIILSQIEAVNKYGTIIDCNFGDDGIFNEKYIAEAEEHITKTLAKLEKNENGFFLMYEEAHIDKYSHLNDMDKMFNALIRFNQAIGRFMEYAFYNPDTFVLITADHETGNLYPNSQGVLTYHSTEHTGKNVPIFAYGYGAELFDGKTVENIQIAHTIAHLMGVDDFGDQSTYQHLGK